MGLKQPRRSPAPLHPLLQRRQHLRIEIAARALVGEGGVGEAIAQHHVAASQRGLDDLHDVVAPRREHQQRFGQRVHRLFEDEPAQGFGQRRAAGLARAHDRAAPRLEKRLHRVEMARLAGAIDAFERQKQAVTHCATFGLGSAPPRW